MGFRNRAATLEENRLATTTDLANRQLAQRAGEFDRNLAQRANEFTNVSDAGRRAAADKEDAAMLDLIMKGGTGLATLLTSPIPAGGSTVGGELISGGGSLLSGLLSLFSGGGGAAGAELLNDPAFLEAAAALI